MADLKIQFDLEALKRIVHDEIREKIGPELDEINAMLDDLGAASILDALSELKATRAADRVALAADVPAAAEPVPAGAYYCPPCGTWEMRGDTHPRCPECGKPWADAPAFAATLGLPTNTTSAPKDPAAADWRFQTCRNCGHLGNHHEANECWVKTDDKQCGCSWMDLADAPAAAECTRCHERAATSLTGLCEPCTVSGGRASGSGWDVPAAADEDARVRDWYNAIPTSGDEEEAADRLTQALTSDMLAPNVRTVITTLLGDGVTVTPALRQRLLSAAERGRLERRAGTHDETEET